MKLNEKQNERFSKELNKRQRVAIEESEDIFFVLENHEDDEFPVLLNDKRVGPVSGIFVKVHENMKKNEVNCKLIEDYLTKFGVEPPDVVPLFLNNGMVFMRREMKEWFSKIGRSGV